MYTAPIALIFRLVFDAFAEKVYLCSFFVKTFLIYFCGAPDINSFPAILLDSVVIFFKIRIFAVQPTSGYIRDVLAMNIHVRNRITMTGCTGMVTVHNDSIEDEKTNNYNGTPS